MALQQVSPGDLITADKWNEVVRNLIDLRTTLDQIMASGFGTSPIIQFILPASPPAFWRVGSAIEIVGANFGVSRGAQTVTFDTFTVTTFKGGTSDTSLRIDIPPLTVPEEGKDVILVVSNGYGSVSRTMRILPLDIPIAGAVIDVFWRSIQPNPINASTPTFVGYSLRSRAGRLATFTITPSIASPVGISGLRIYRSLTEELPGAQIQLAPLQEQEFFVRIPALPTTITEFTLETEGTAGSAAGSDIRTFPIGSAIIEPDETIALTPLFFEAIRPDNGLPDPAGGSYSHGDATIRVRADRSGIMHLRAEFQQAGSYDVRVVLVGSPAGWVIGLSETPSSIVIDPADFAGGARVASETFNFLVTPPTGTTTGAVAEFQVSRAGSAQGQRRRFNLQVQTS